MDNLAEIGRTFLAWLKHHGDRHIRAVAIVLGLIAVPSAMLCLVPTALKVTANPMDLSLELLSVETGSLALTFLDSENHVIGHQGPVLGRHLALAEMPSYLPAAFVAMEDRRFFAHQGVDFVRLARALYADLRAQRFVAGGSTIHTATNVMIAATTKAEFGFSFRT